MESQTPQTTDIQTPSGFSSDSPGIMTPAKSSPADKPVQDYIQIGTKFISEIYDYIAEFISNNEKVLVNLLLLFLAIISVRVTLAILSAINDIPLLAPMFELVGLGYTGWFVYRYLLKESSRQDLKQEFEALKTQVMGKDLIN
jgi:hypothetical protein